MRTLMLDARDTPRQWGREHGESFRGEIRSLADIRVYLAVQLGGFAGAAEVLEVAGAHLPVLERYDRALYDELLGIAEGAGVSPGHVVVLNHYTDLRDIGPKISGAGAVDIARQPASEGCSVVWARTPSGPILAQTWDMHATAMPYMLMLRVPERDGRRESWLLSLTGCLGMAGMNVAGVGVAINNLRSTDARVGLVWPALVRRALSESTARSGRDVILRSPIGSGHHYLVADADHAFGIETSGTRRKQIFAAGEAGDSAYVHTNHCLDADIDAVSQVVPTSTTRERYDWLTRSLERAPVCDVHDLWKRLGSDEGYPRSVCTNLATPENPHGTATCGAIAMELGSRRVWAQAGLIHNVAPIRFEFAEVHE